MSQPKKLVVVTAATGSQGFPIAKYLLSTNRYNVRALTRRIDSSHAKLLKDLGAEVVFGDYDVPSSLSTAFSGADAIFCNTNFWEHLSIDDEIRQGVAAARAAAGVPSIKNFVYSHLADARTLFEGKYQDNLTYNAKSITLERIQAEFPELWKITTTLSVAFFYDNWIKYQLPFGPIKRQDGVLEMAMPYPSNHKIPTASPDDAGVVIAAIIDAGDKYYGKWISLVAESLTDDEKIATFVKALGVHVEFKQVSPEQYQQRLEAAGLPEHIALSTTQLCSMAGSGLNYIEADPIIKARDIIDPTYKFQTWEEYVKKADWSSVL